MHQQMLQAHRKAIIGRLEMGDGPENMANCWYGKYSEKFTM